MTSVYLIDVTEYPNTEYAERYTIKACCFVSMDDAKAYILEHGLKNLGWHYSIVEVLIKGKLNDEIKELREEIEKLNDEIAHIKNGEDY